MFEANHFKEAVQRFEARQLCQQLILLYIERLGYPMLGSKLLSFN
jgi:hypothetical protein